MGGGKKDNVGPNKLTGNTVVMRSILGPCLVFDTLHEATVSISCEFIELKKTCSRKPDMLSKPGNGTVHG